MTTHTLPQGTLTTRDAWHRITRLDMSTYNPAHARYRWARYLFTELRSRLSPAGLALARKAYLDALEVTL